MLFFNFLVFSKKLGFFKTIFFRKTFETGNVDLYIMVIIPKNLNLRAFRIGVCRATGYGEKLKQRHPGAVDASTVPDEHRRRRRRQSN